jgi:hypothetical protein
MLNHTHVQEVAILVENGSNLIKLHALLTPLATSDLRECQKVTKMDIYSVNIGNPWLWTLSDIGTHV